MNRWFALMLALVALTPGPALAGSWMVNCDLNALKLSFNAEHYRPTKKGDYGVTPIYVDFSVGGKTVKARSKKLLGDIWIYRFPEHTVVYTGIRDGDTAKHATFLDKRGAYLGTAACK